MPGSESISAPGNALDPGRRNWERGRRCENIVKEYFQQKEFLVLAVNLPLVFAEIDLVMLSPEKEVWLIEVKSVFDSDLIFTSPIKAQQKARLRRALERWMGGVTIPVRLHLAAVNHLDRVSVFHDVLGL